MKQQACSIDGCEKTKRTAGLCGMHYLRKWKHGSPHVRLSAANGEGNISTQGYKIITVNGVRIAEHVHICQQAIGKPLPKGAQVHHVNEIKTDNRPANLVICPDAGYHQLLHVRARAMAESGDPDKRQCWHCKQWDIAENLYTAKQSHNGYHHACRNKLRRSGKNA